MIAAVLISACTTGKESMPAQVWCDPGMALCWQSPAIEFPLNGATHQGRVESLDIMLEPVL